MNRIYLAFVSDEALQYAMKACQLDEAEKAEMQSCVRKCVFDGCMRTTLVLADQNYERIPRPYREMARESFEQFLEEDLVKERKNSTGLNATQDIRNFGLELPVYSGNLHNF